MRGSSELVSASNDIAYTVDITNSGERFRCTSAQALLAAMESLGRRGIPVGCRGGGCGVCKLRIDAGRVTVGAMSRACVSADEENTGFVLACRARPASDLTVTAVDRLAGCIRRGMNRETARSSFLSRATGTVPSTTLLEGDSSWP